MGLGTVVQRQTVAAGPTGGLKLRADAIICRLFKARTFHHADQDDPQIRVLRPGKCNERLLQASELEIALFAFDYPFGAE